MQEMEWLDVVKARVNKKNQILFSPKDLFLKDLSDLVDAQSHVALVLWAFEFAEEGVKKLEKKYKNEIRPRNAIEITKLWASGKAKMPAAKKAILECHSFAKEIDSKEDVALCHAIGQACGVVHTPGHALGFPIYDLTSVVYALGIDSCIGAIGERKQEYIDKLLYWEENQNSYRGSWADFLKNE